MRALHLPDRPVRGLCDECALAPRSHQENARVTHGSPLSKGTASPRGAVVPKRAWKRWSVPLFLHTAVGRLRTMVLMYVTRCTGEDHSPVILKLNKTDHHYSLSATLLPEVILVQVMWPRPHATG